MFLCITFNGETMPFLLHDSDEECLRAIEVVKKDFNFNRQTAIIKNDFVYLEAFKKHSKKRIYVYKDRVILETSSDYTDEIDATKKLLAYEKQCSQNEIYAVDV